MPACRLAGINVTNIPHTILARIPKKLRRTRPHPTTVTSEEMDELRDLIVNGGMSITDASKQIGRSMNGILKHLKIKAPDLQVQARKSRDEKTSTNTRAA